MKFASMQPTAAIRFAFDVAHFCGQKGFDTSSTAVAFAVADGDDEETQTHENILILRFELVRSPPSLGSADTCRR